MTVPDHRDPRLTEQRNPRTERIDVASTLEIVDLLNGEDATVAGAVRAVRAELARAIDLVVDAFGRGGRLIYVGAGTSGRLGVLDASECPPTFGTPPEMVVGVIAGGYPALVKSSEGAEDDVNAGMAAMDQARVTPVDFVLGIAASGTTPFVRAPLSRAQTIGAATGLVSCSDPPRVLVETCDVLVLPKVGPEALTGSTRMKAGTATKLVLNTLSTGAMIRLGRAYGNLMVDLMELSDKLRDRGERIVMECCNVDRAAARGAIEAAGGSVKLAIVMARRGVRKAEAERLLAEAGGFVRKAAGDAQLVAFRQDPYTTPERGQIIEAIARGGSKDLALLHVALGERFAGAVLQLLAQAKVAPRDLSFIASHGQTIWHEPGRATLQLGDPAVIAERVGRSEEH